MLIDDRLRLWNRNKWEAKNLAMYRQHGENRWPWFNRQLDQDIAAWLQQRQARQLDILDLGTCSGTQAIALAKLGHKVVGTEVSDTALADARRAASRESPDLPLQWIIDDITSTSLPEQHFELVLDRGCYHSICVFHHEQYVAGVKRVLKPDGILLLKVMSHAEQRFVNYDKLGNKRVPMPFHFRQAQLQQLLSPHFELLQISDSYFYSTVTAQPARAILLTARNRPGQSGLRGASEPSGFPPAPGR